MGSTESTLSSMEGEQNIHIENNNNNYNNNNSNSNSDNNNNNDANVNVVQRRQRRETDTDSNGMADDPWWWEIENENLILDQVPNVTTVNSENENVLSEDFHSLLKIGEELNLNVNATGTTSTVNTNSNSVKNNHSDDHGDDDVATTSHRDDSVIAKNNIIPKDYSSNVVISEKIQPTQQQQLQYSECEKSQSARSSGGVPQYEQTLEEFKEELRVKRLARQSAVQDLREEIATLRKQLATEQAITRQLRSGSNDDDDDDDDEDNDDGSVSDNNVVHECKSADTSATVSKILPKKLTEWDEAVASVAIPAATVVEDDNDEPDTDDEDPMSRGRHANIELANAQLSLQLANAENLSLRTELGVVQKQVGTLKEVIACCKQMLSVKEEQCTQLKAKLDEIETSFNERELKIMSSNLRQEYERQLSNIRQLRQLYEERQRVSAAEHENLQRLISIKKDELLAEQEKTKNFEERNQTLVKEVETANNELSSLREECNEHKFEKKALKEEMGAVNMLFTQMVMGFNGKNNLDIDRLTMMLEENRTLLNDMATKEANCSDGATLPKLLFELVEQATVSSKSGSRSPTPTLLSAEEDAEGAEDELVVEEHDNDNDGEEKQICDNENNNHDNGNTNNNNNNNNNNNSSDNLNVSENGNRTASDEEVSSRQEVIANDTTDGHIDAASCNGDNNANNVTDMNTTTTNSKAGKKHHRRSVGSNKTKAMSILKFHETEVIGKVASAQEIIGNLPKVWKVLMELLSHHKIEQVQFEENGLSEDCYKSVQTPNGPKAELSVSKTYIKLKDLILEKKSLVKETNHLKTLNGHLEYRLNEQEKRLSTVSLELTKTWHLVGKMQRQHRQLHTQEQILRYQLQQKRRLLNELKDEIEYCRRKWAAARAKNDESQEQYNDLRREFAKRKLDDANMSAESGYSDSGPASDEDERATTVATVAVDDATIVASGSIGTGVGGVGGGASCRRKYLKEMFEHTRKIKRMQSTSPGRAAYGTCADDGGGSSGGGGVAGVDDDIVLRWNSAPPTCGWRGGSEADDDDGDNDDDDEDDDDCDDDSAAVEVHGLDGSATNGAISKSSAARCSRSRQRNRKKLSHNDADAAAAPHQGGDETPRTERATRIHRLEEQCKSLIQQVLETSDNRERLEVQLCRFQDTIAPVQYAIPLDEYINRKRLERMTRASSAPATGTLTPREEEYTRKRSERLGRLEEESRQLMSRIKRTSDRGNYLRCSLDRLRRAPSREGSFESNTEEEINRNDEPKDIAEKCETTEVPVVQPANVVEKAVAEENGVLTAEEEAYTARRAARLQRLEEESKQLMTKLSNNTQRGDALDSKLDALHNRYGSENREQSEPRTQDVNDNTVDNTEESKPATIEERIENIEKISSNRDERMSILEEEGRELLARLSNTSARGTRMINHIAERESQRQAQKAASSTSKGVSGLTNEKPAVANDDGTVATPSQEDASVTSELMPTIKNVVCTSIVGEELTDHVTVTTIPSQIASQHGAVPKSQPTAQLCASRSKSTRIQIDHKDDKSKETESLEEMVKRLSSLPFPENEQQDVEQKDQPEQKETEAKNDTKAVD